MTPCSTHCHQTGLGLVYRHVNKGTRASILSTPTPAVGEPAKEQERKGASDKNATALRTAKAPLAAFVAGTACLTSQAAQAASGREWQPRRHHRRIVDKQSVVDLAKPMKAVKQAAVEVSQQANVQVHSAVEEAWHTASSLQKKVASVLHNGAGESDRDLCMGVRAGPRPTVAPAYVRALQTGLGWTALATAGVVLLWLLAKVPGLLVARLGGRAQGGRWVRDRSLGGKLVFIPDTPAEHSVPHAAGSDAGAPATIGRQLRGDAAVARVEGASTSAVGLDVQEYGPHADAMPEWWRPSPRLHVSPAYKQEAERNAQRILRELEDRKLAGQDYSITDLVRLRQVCGEGGVSVRPRTESGRDAMLRAGAEAAASAAMQAGGAQLGGMPPSRFVTGLARDLGIPEDKAATIALAVISARARAALIDACAAYRENNTQEAFFQLLRLAGLLDAMPLPPGSAQADMVAASILQRATLLEREAIFMTYGQMEPRTAGIVAEMLAFDPKLVVPQLQAERSSEG